MARSLYNTSRFMPVFSVHHDGYTRMRITYIISFSSILLSVFLFSCGNSDKEVNEYNSKSLGIEEIKNADINYTLGGKAKAKLLSPLMYRKQILM